MSSRVFLGAPKTKHFRVPINNKGFFWPKRNCSVWNVFAKFEESQAKYLQPLVRNKCFDPIRI